MAELRGMRAADADDVAALIVHENPQRSIDGREVREWLSQGLIDPDDVRVVADGARILGYADIYRRGDLATLDVSGHGREDQLLDWAEARARECGSTAVRLSVWEGQDDLAAVLARREYARRRSSFDMFVELGGEPPRPPVWPEGLEPRPYRHPEDERVTYEAQEDAFRDTWEHRPVPIEHWRAFSLGGRGFDPSLWFLAWDAGDVAGICMAFPERIGDPSMGWIAALGVRRRWRRRGLGEALLRHAFRELHARGLRRIGLDVDSENPTGATRLYERVGMRVAVRSDSWGKEL